MSASFTGGLAVSDRRRQETWLKEVATTVDALRQKEGLSIGDVTNDAVFVGAVIKGLRIVRETQRQEKLQLVANAVGNSGSWSANTDAVQVFFMRLLERYEPEHMMLLSACDDPQGFIQRHKQSAGTGEMHWIFANIIYENVIEWEPLASMVLRDVSQDQLVRAGGLGLGFNLSEEKQKVTSPMGHDFLMFCSASSSPKDL